MPLPAIQPRVPTLQDNREQPQTNRQDRPLQTSAHGPNLRHPKAHPRKDQLRDAALPPHPAVKPQEVPDWEREGQDQHHQQVSRGGD